MNGPCGCRGPVGHHQGGRGGGRSGLFEVTVGTGGGEAPHVQHREDECLYVLEGRFALLVEGAVTEAGPGAHLYVPKGVLHAYENAGDETGRLLVVHTPGGSQERFLAAAGESTTGPANHAGRNQREFALSAAEHGIEMC